MAILVQLDKLAPKLIRRALKKNYILRRQIRYCNDRIEELEV